MLLAVIHKACRAERLILAPTLSFSLPLSAFLPLSPQHHSRSFNAARAAPSKCLPAKKLSKLHHHGLPLIRPQPATQERRLQARSASQLANQKKKKKTGNAVIVILPPSLFVLGLSTHQVVNSRGGSPRCQTLYTDCFVLIHGGLSMQLELLRSPFEFLLTCFSLLVLMWRHCCFY